MTWEATQAIAELIAAAGVILSLVYLSRQVHENTQSVRAAANQDLMTAFNDATSFASYSRYGARLYHHTIGARWAELDEEDRAAARMVLLRTIRVVEQAHLQYRSGFLDGGVWEGWRRQIAVSIGLSGFVDAWPAIRQVVNSDFAQFIDSLILEAPKAVQGWAGAWRAGGMGHAESSAEHGAS